MDSVRSCVWRNGVLTREGFQLDELDQLLKDPANLVWVDLCAPEPELLAKLASELRFDQHVVEDALAPGERPKVSHFANHLFATVYAAWLGDSQNFESRVRVSRVSTMVMERGLITVRRDDGFDLDQVTARWADNSQLVEFGVGGLLHGLLDAIVDGHFTTIQAIDDSMEDLEDMLFDDRPHTKAMQHFTYQLRRELVEMRRIVLPMRDVVQSVLRDQASHVDDNPELRAYYEDLTDHVMRESEWTESLRDLVGSIYETNLAINDTRMNIIMKKLSGWAAIIAVPTLITGWYGQNVPYLGSGDQFGLISSAVLIVGSVTTLFILFKIHDWI